MSTGVGRNERWTNALLTSTAITKHTEARAIISNVHCNTTTSNNYRLSDRRRRAGDTLSLAYSSLSSGLCAFASIFGTGYENCFKVLLLLILSSFAIAMTSPQLQHSPPAPTPAALSITYRVLGGGALDVESYVIVST